jgi:hypothetical protein
MLPALQSPLTLYAEAHSTPIPAVLQELRQATERLESSQMLLGVAEARLLRLLVGVG